jgi:hypothetical protein
MVCAAFVLPAVPACDVYRCRYHDFLQRGRACRPVVSTRAGRIRNRVERYREGKNAIETPAHAGPFLFLRPCTSHRSARGRLPACDARIKHPLIS